jgi:hypothetical protein
MPASYTAALLVVVAGPALLFALVEDALKVRSASQEGM